MCFLYTVLDTKNVRNFMNSVTMDIKSETSDDHRFESLLPM